MNLKNSTVMKEAIVWSREGGRLEVEIRDAPIPSPGRTQILIKVVVSGTNPKDWKAPVNVERLNGTNSGDDIAGIVHSVGEDVTEFHPGDRVAAFHEMNTPHGSFAQYAISEAHCAFHLPTNTTFEEAATIPLAAMTAVVALFSRLGLSEPWLRLPETRIDAERGVIVYGGATAVGAFALKLLQKSDIHPIYTVAGKGIDFVKELVDPAKNDQVFDYREGDETLIRKLREALNGQRLKHALDAVSEKGSYNNIVEILEPNGRLTTMIPTEKYEGVPATVDRTLTYVGDVHTHDKELGAAWFRLFGIGLREGWLTPHPFHVVPQGLRGLEKALTDLRHGKASAIKYVVRIDDTPELL